MPNNMYCVLHAVALVLAVTLGLLCPSPVRAYQITEEHDNCQLCVDSSCHKDRNRPCVPTYDECVLCYWCPEATPTEKPEYDTKEACESACEKKENCICDGKCYVCVKDGTDVSDLTCDTLEFMFDDTCVKVPFKAP